MKTPAIEDFDTIARNRKRINDEQTWRAKDAGYGDAQIKELPGVAGTLKPKDFRSGWLICRDEGHASLLDTGRCSRCHTIP